MAGNDAQPIADDTGDLFKGLLSKLIGTSTNTKSTEDLSVVNLLKQLTQGTSNQNTVGITNQNTNQNVGTTSNQTQTGSNTSTQSVQANIDALKQVFNQQQAGITPDALRAIFTEGSKAVPGLTAATANAVGARSGDNSALGTALTDLNSNLTSQAATQSQAMRNASGTTAAQIAELTKQLTTSGTNTAGTIGTQNQNTLGTVGTTQNVTQVGTTTQNQDTTQNQNSRKDGSQHIGTTINGRSTGITAGLAGLASLLNGGGGKDSGNIYGNIGSLLNKFFNGGGGGGINGGSYVPSSSDVNTIYGNDGYGSTDMTIGDPSISNYVDGSTNLSDFGFADGGLVDVPKLKLGMQKKSPEIDPSKLLGMFGGNSFDFSNFMGKTGHTGSSNTGGQTGNEEEGGGGPASNASAPSTAASSAVGNTIGSIVGALVSSIAAPPGLISAINAISSATGHGKPIPTLSSIIASIASNATSGGASAAAASPSISVDGAPAVAASVATDAEQAEADAANDAANAATAAANAANNSNDSNSDEGSSDSATGDSASADGASGTNGDDGDSGDGSGGSGWVDGGAIPRQPGDNNGTKDVLGIKVTGGEYMMPKDVVDYMGVDFFDSLKSMFHTPVAEQESFEPPGAPDDEKEDAKNAHA